MTETAEISIGVDPALGMSPPAMVADAWKFASGISSAESGVDIQWIETIYERYKEYHLHLKFMGLVKILMFQMTDLSYDLYSIAEELTLDEFLNES